MRAHIVPVARLPRSFESFSYQVPESLHDKMMIGQLVFIPFRNSQKLGIVLSLDQEYQPALKPITSIVHAQPLVSSVYLDFVKHVSSLYATSMSTLFQMWFPTFSKRSLKTLELIPFQNTILNTPHEIARPLYCGYTTESEHQKTIQNAIGKGQTLFLVPEKQHIHQIYEYIPNDLKNKTLLWQGDMKLTEKRTGWVGVRNGEYTIIIGTRSTLFLPFFDLQTVYVEYEHHHEHKNSDQNPRFTVKDETKYLREHFGIQEIHAGYSQSIASYYMLYKGKYKNPVPLEPSGIKTDSLFTVKDMNIERKSGNSSPISEHVQECMQNLNQDILLLVKRKGSATGVQCKDCAFEEKCSDCSLFFVYHEKKGILQCHYCKRQKKISLVCPQCASAQWLFQGMGTEGLEKKVRDMSRGKKIIRIDGDIDINPAFVEAYMTDPKPKIFIGTEKAIEYVDWGKIGLVVLIDFDRQVNYPEYKATENMWHLLDEIVYKKSNTCEFVIQTSNPKHIILKSLAERDRFYRTELNNRRSFGYPPYTFLVKMFGSHASENMCLSQAKKLCGEMEIILTKLPKKGRVIGPVEMQPKYFQGKFWYGILIKIDASDTENFLTQANLLLPAEWKVDPNPETILNF